MSELNRRPIKARSLSIFQNLAAYLARTNITPNQISVASVLFSGIVPLSFLAFPNSWLAYILAALGIQLRLFCNLLDGMVAVEGAKKSVLGDIYNEFPDRLSDSIIILGFALPEMHQGRISSLAWAACFVAVMTAYTRVLGAAVGAKHYFIGPMAKQHRMALITFSLVLIPILQSRIEQFAFLITESLLWFIIAGGMITVIRRLQFISSELVQR